MGAKLTKGRQTVIAGALSTGEMEIAPPASPSLYGWAREEYMPDLEDGSEAATGSSWLGVVTRTGVLAVLACPHFLLRLPG